MNPNNIETIKAHIKELEESLALQGIKLTNVRARLVIAAHPIQVVRRVYPETNIDHLGMSPYEWLTAVHQAWVQDTQAMLDQLRCELILHEDLSEVITDPASFMNHMVEYRIKWPVLLETLKAIVGTKSSI